MPVSRTVIVILLPRHMHQRTVAVHTFFFIARSRVDNGSMGQHGAAFVRNIQQISVALHALLIFKRGISCLAVFFSIIFALHKMNDDVFNTVECLLVEKIKGVMGGGKMAIHAVGNKSLGVIDVGGGFPGIVGSLDLVAGCAKFRR